MWRYRALSIIGKIQVVNSQVSSLATYKLMCLPNPPAEFYEQYHQQIRDFLWNGKISKIAHDKIIQMYEHGGLKLVDLKNMSLKAGWVYRSCTSYAMHGYSPILAMFPIKSPMIWECYTSHSNFDNMQEMKHCTLPYQVWSSWAQVNVMTPQNVSDVLDQNLWFNTHIKRMLNMWYIPETLQVGVNTVSDTYTITS